MPAVPPFSLPTISFNNNRKCIFTILICFQPGPEPPNLSGVTGAAGTVLKDAIFLMGGQVNRRYPTDLLVLWPHAPHWLKIGKLRQPRRGFQAAFLGLDYYEPMIT